MPDMDVVTVNGRRYVPAPTYDITEGAERIARERADQVVLRGWTDEHDDEHAEGDLYEAAIAYLLAIGEGTSQPPPDVWPWDESSWKPSKNPIRNLEKAGALIAAEIDRMLRKGRSDLGERLEAMGL